MMEGEKKYIAGLIALGLAFGVGTYFFGDGLYFIVITVLFLAVLIELLRVVILRKDRKKLRELWAELKDAFGSF